MKRILLIGLCLALISASAYAQNRRRPDTGPKVGTMAPDFTCKVLAKDETVTLQERVKTAGKPIVLLFGSYT